MYYCDWKRNWKKIAKVGNGLIVIPEATKEKHCCFNDAKMRIIFNEKRKGRPDLNAKNCDDKEKIAVLPISQTPFGEDVYENPLKVAEKGKYVMIANKYPVIYFHTLICSRVYLYQNDFAVKTDIREISSILENMGERGFQNMFNGGAASLPHYHAQLFPSNFPIEAMKTAELDKNVRYVENWGGNLVISGTLDERINLLDKIIKSYKEKFRGKPKTVKADGSESDRHIFTLLFYSDKIVFLPRKRECPTIEEFKDTKFGGLEVSGIFVFDEPAYESADEKKLFDAVRSVTYDQDIVFDIYKSVIAQ